MVSFVRFQYPEEEIQQIEGDDYTIEVEWINTTQWQAVGDADVLIANHPYEKTNWYTAFLFTEKQGEISKGDTTTFGGRKIGESWRFGGHTIYVGVSFNGEFVTPPNYVVTPSEIFNFTRTFLSHFRERFPGDTEPRYYYDNPVFRRWHPVNGDKQVTFKITLEDAFQFSRTEINKDIVFAQIIQCSECPQDTCPVLCGDTICCYNTEGISIDSFLKEESIY